MNEGVKRRQKRYRVNFTVRFGTAREFVEEYAENLSTGGLFVRGAHGLTDGEPLVIELDLPGFDTFIVTAKVAHVITPAEAGETNRRPGAGLTIVNTPEGFAEAMRGYLLRLGKRRDHLVLVAADEIRTLASEAGYQTRPLPAPSALATVIKSVQAPVLAVLVGRGLYGPYASAAETSGVSDLVYTIDYVEEFDEILRILDTRLDL
jgi:Tfp pilus assembly protein PilZ